MRIRGKPFGTEVRRNFFTQRVVNVWNSLPQNGVEVKTLCDFKKKLDVALGAKGIKGYEGKGGIRILNLMISHDQNQEAEWVSAAPSQCQGPGFDSRLG